jgi:hypothetical protein
MSRLPSEPMSIEDDPHWPPNEALDKDHANIVAGFSQTEPQPDNSKLTPVPMSIEDDPHWPPNETMDKDHANIVAAF